MAKRKNIEETRLKKRGLFIQRTAQSLGISEEHVAELFSHGLTPAVRLNPLKGATNETLNAMTALGWSGEPISWCPSGYTVTAGFEALRDSELIESGAVYIQNLSSWLPVLALDPHPGENVLDVCAAPGGKTSHIAALMNNQGRLVANDNSRARLMKLQRNLQRLGAAAEYTLHDATRLSRNLEGQQFDAILLDAPCSGEGLIDLRDLKTLDTWSVAHIRRLSDLQKKLLFDAWKLLKPGGRLVYSTCTLAPEEDELVIDWFLRRTNGASVHELNSLNHQAIPSISYWNERELHAEVTKSLRIPPYDGQEAFFVCALEKAAA